VKGSSTYNSTPFSALFAAKLLWSLGSAALVEDCSAKYASLIG